MTLNINHMTVLNLRNNHFTKKVTNWNEINSEFIHFSHSYQILDRSVMFSLCLTGFSYRNYTSSWLNKKKKNVKEESLKMSLEKNSKNF